MEDAEFLEESQEYAPYDKLENVLRGWNGSTPLIITPEQVERLKLLAYYHDNYRRILQEPFVLVGKDYSLSVPQGFNNIRSRAGRTRITYTNDLFRDLRKIDGNNPTPAVIDTKPYVGMVPAGTRFAAQYQTNKFVFVVEIPPKINNLRTNRQTVNRVGWKLRMPWQYFVVQLSETNGKSRLHSLSIYWSKTQVQSIDDPVIVARLPNVDDRGYVCFGTTYTDIDLSIPDRVASVVGQFFTPASRFNRDLQWNLPRDYRSFSEWQNASRDENCYIFWSDWRWHGGNPISEYVPQMRTLGLTEEGEESTSSSPINLDILHETVREWGW